MNSMKKIIFFCDKCGKQLEEPLIKVETFIADKDGEPVTGQDITIKDLCENCMKDLTEWFKIHLKKEKPLPIKRMKRNS